MKVVLLDYPPYGPCDVEARVVEALGGEFEVVDYEEFVGRPRPADIVLNLGGWPLPRSLVERLEGTRCLVGYGVGLDGVDVDEATRRGILVVRMPTVNVVEVATHTLALMLACARRLLQLDRHVRDGGFAGIPLGPYRRLSSLRLGLLAFGNIPRVLARFAAPLGLAISACDPHVADETMRAHGVEPAELESLLRASDILSVHLPTTPETVGLIDERRIRMLPRGAIFVATSRGAVYDDEALARALTEGHVAAAGLDVFGIEPLPADHPLREAPNVILTPHIAGHSEEFLREVHETAAAVIEALARGETPPGAVNADKVSASR